jgi:hypothetical protein
VLFCRSLLRSAVLPPADTVHTLSVVQYARTRHSSACGAGNRLARGAGRNDEDLRAQQSNTMRESLDKIDWGAE